MDPPAHNRCCHVVGGPGARRRRDVGDHEVALGRGRGPGGERHVPDVDHVAHVAARQVHGDVVGDVPRRDVELRSLTVAGSLMLTIIRLGKSLK